MQDRDGGRRLGRWLLVCAALVAAMVVVGGVTRVTGSGLSIPRWRVVTGIVPPIGAEAWASAFAEYRATPEFAQVNRAIDLDGYKSIFLVEWAHRLLARTVVLVFAAVVAVGWRRKTIPPGMGRWLGGIVGLFLAQGVVGWWMVASGLVDRPSVSPQRMAVHLDLALVLFALLVGAGLDALRGMPRREPSRSSWLARATVVMVIVTATWGALMAGLHAGHVSNTFPKMLGAWVPEGLLVLDPWSRNFWENALAVHFTHRALAVATLVVAALAARAAFAGPSPARRAAGAFVAAVIVQGTLGALVVMLHVPRALAVVHQAGALLVLAAAVALERAVGRKIGAPAPEAAPATPAPEAALTS